MPVTVLHEPGEVDPLSIELRLPASDAVGDRRPGGDLRPRRQRGRWCSSARWASSSTASTARRAEDKTIYHKNLRRVVYVYGEVAGRPPADAIIDMRGRPPAGRHPADHAAEPAARSSERTWLSPGGGDPWSVPAGYTVKWAGEGEWKITLDVFRDLGLAFGAALLGIFVILMFETGSRVLPLVIMLAIPLTMIGIMPGFWLLNVLVDRPVGRLSQPGLLHRHGHDRHDRPGRHRGPQLGRADRLHPPRPRPRACRCARR